MIGLFGNRSLSIFGIPVQSETGVMGCLKLNCLHFITIMHEKVNYAKILNLKITVGRMSKTFGGAKF